MQALKEFQQILDKELANLKFADSPKNLYDPIRYFLSLGGKRMRPISVLMAHKMFGGDRKNAINIATAIEVFHNFTLVHDDIMDEAPLRRGKATVHEKWNTNIAILCGDTMLVKAYVELAKTDPKHLPKVLEIFNRVGVEVCEGQQFDMEFESRSDVAISEYIEMIRLKTAVLLGGALQVGAVAAGAPDKEVEALRLFGENIGIAFQLQDDILDVYADQEKFGKQVGGDILAAKKTFLLLKAFEKSNDAQKKRLNELLHSEIDAASKVSGVMAIYDALEVKAEARAAMEEYHQKGMDALASISLPEEAKKPLKQLADYLFNRDF